MAKLRLRLLFCIFSFFTTHTLSYGQSNGTLAGRLTDARTGEELVGANVVIVGTTRGAVTDLDGKYTFSVEPGTYDLEARSIGYRSKRVLKVAVRAGQTQLVSFTLESSDVELTEVEVVATASKNNENSVLSDQRAAAGVSSAVSAELLARTPDRSMAESLRRVSGTSIRDGRFAVVRGLQERYNQGQVNGMQQPSTEADRKAFALDLFPTALVDKVTVFKTGTPDLPGDFAGGVVRVTTVDIPFSNTISVTAGAETHSLTTGKTFLTGTTSPTDILGFDNGSRALPQGIYSRQEAGQDPGLQTEARQARLQQNNFGAQRNNPAGPNLYFQAFLGRRGTLWGKQAGMVIGANYYRTVQYSDFLNFNLVSERIDSATGRRSIVDFDSLAQRRFRVVASLSGVANFSFRPDAASKISFRNMVTQTGNSFYVQGDGKQIDGQASIQNFRKTFIDFYDENRLNTHQLAYERVLGTDGGRLEVLTGITLLNRSTPDQRRLTYVTSRQVSDPSPLQPYRVNLLTVTREFNPNFAGKFFSTLYDESFNGAVNLAYPANFGKVKNMIKTGGYFQDRFRSYDGRNFNYSYDLRSAEAVAPLLTQGPDSIFRPQNMGGGLIYLRETTAASDFYKAAARLSAGYLMSETKIGEDDRLRLVYGMRVERYWQNVRSATLDGVPVNPTSTVVDWLPSMNLQFAIRKNLYLRGAYFASVNRPEFRELSPSAYYDPTQNNLVFGNPDIVRAKIHNFDAKLEWYPQDGAVFSLNPYYKRINQAIEFARENIASFPTFTFRNAQNATVAGIEGEVRLTPGQLLRRFSDEEIVRPNAFINNLTVFANAALIQSLVRVRELLPNGEAPLRPLQGQSPYTLNAGATYVHKPTNLEGTLTVNRTGTRLAFVGDNYLAGLWEAPRTVIDASVSYRKDRWLVKGTLGDLLAQPLTIFQIYGDNLSVIDQTIRRDFLGTPMYQKGTDIPFFRTTYGRTIRLSLTYSL